jgi:hypothetical protein
LLRSYEEVEYLVVTCTANTTDVVVLSVGLEVYNVAVLDLVSSFKSSSITSNDVIAVCTKVTSRARSRYI